MFHSIRAAAAAAVLGAGLGAQDDPFAQRGDSLYSLPRSQEDIHSWKTAREELEAGEHESAVERLHRLLQRDRGGVVPTGIGRFLGRRQAVVRVLRDLSPAARAEYERLVEREGGRRLHIPFAHLEEAQLEALARDYPASERGLLARLRLGHLALEAGDGIRAAAHFRAALDACPPDSERAERITRSLDAAEVLVRPRMHRDHDVPGIHTETATAVLEALPAGLDPTDWPAYGGGRGGNRPMDRPAGRARTVRVFEQIRAPRFPANPFAMHAVGGLDGVYVQDGQSLWALDPLQGSVLWRFSGPMSSERYLDDEGVNKDLVLAPAVGDDVVVAALEVPVDEDSLVYRTGITIMTVIPDRRLFAFDRATGKLRWAHFDSSRGPVTRRYSDHIASAPPLVHGDTVYCATHRRAGTIAYYLSAYDAGTGEVKWRRLLCSSQQEVNMFGNAKMEFAAGPMTLSGGVVYGTTNLGVCYAVDARSGDIRWISSYDVIPLPQARLHNQQDRPVYFANNAPVVVDDVVVTTPLDSRSVLGMDADTGQLLWELDFLAQRRGNNHVRWLLGALGDEVILGGRGVVAVKARSGGPDLEPEMRVLRTPESLGNDRNLFASHIGRGAVTDELVYYTTPQRVTAFDGEGNEVPGSGDLRFVRPGNLLLVDGLAVSVRRAHVAIAYDLEQLRERAQQLVHRDRDNVRALYRLASLLRGGGGGDAAERAEALLGEALQAAGRKGMGRGTPLWNRIASDLFEITLDRARSATGEKALEAFRTARERAPDTGSWMTAQLALIERIDDDEVLLQELARMERRHGTERHRFGYRTSIPVAAEAMRRRALVLERREPAASVRVWQQLLERHPAERIDGESLRVVARQAIQRLIDRHGREIYADIEARAAETLEMADDPEELQAVVHMFPHSEAARDAGLGILDLALEHVDLATGCEVLADALDEGTPAPGILRRVQRIAAAAGNRAFAAGLGRYLVRRHGDEPSELPADGGRTFGEVAAPGSLPSPEHAALDLPAHLLREYHVSGTVQEPRQVAGTGVPAGAPLYVMVGGDEIQALDPERPGSLPLFRRRISDWQPEPLTLAGEALIVVGYGSAEAFHHRSGEPLWRVEAGEDRILESLGTADGVLVLHASHRTPHGPGELLGVEPTTGTVLYERTVHGDAQGQPTASGSEILFVDTADTPEVVRLDGATGIERLRVPLGAEVLERLHLDRDRLLTRQIGKQMFADGDTVHLVTDPTSNGEAPAIAALRPDGSVRWHWDGLRDHRLEMQAVAGDRIVVVEASVQGGRVLLLDRASGEVRLERSLGWRITTTNWSGGIRDVPVPPALVITDHPRRNSPLRLTFLGLEPGLPSFQTDLRPEDDEVLPTPRVGEGFVVFGTRRDGAIDSFSLYVLDLATRSGALPGGDKTLALEVGPDSHVHRHGRYTVIRSYDRLTVLGREREDK